jgi:hypothetical protein
MNLRIYIFLLILTGITGLARAQAPEGVDTTQILLLEDKDIQISSAQAINDMYNFKFDQAEEVFKRIGERYPDHPIAYFLMGLSTWWKININYDDEQYDKKFLAYVDTAIYFAKKLYDTPDRRIEGAFFLAAGYGFEARLHAERSEWIKSALASKNSLKYFGDCKGNSYLSPELMFGDAIFNYFSVWIPENYPFLKPIMAFFPKGDKELGLKQLKTVANNAFYTRTEAQYFLMRILASDENDQQGAMLISEYLHKTFPDNSYFHRYYDRMLYSLGFTGETERQSLKILDRIDSGTFGYGDIEGRWASFFLGQVNERKRNFDAAKKYYNMCIVFSEHGNAEESGYYLYSNLSLGEIAMREGDKKTAKEYFKKVRKDSKRKDSANKRARSLLKELQ